MSAPPKGLLIYVQGELTTTSCATYASAANFPGLSRAVANGCCGLVGIGSWHSSHGSKCEQGISDLLRLLGQGSASTRDTGGHEEIPKSVDTPILKHEQSDDLFATDAGIPLSVPLGAEDDPTASSNPPPLPPGCVKRSQFLDLDSDDASAVESLKLRVLQELNLMQSAAAAQKKIRPCDLVLLHCSSTEQLAFVDALLSLLWKGMYSEVVEAKLYVALYIGIAKESIRPPQHDVAHEKTFGGVAVSSEFLAKIRPPQSCTRLSGSDTGDSCDGSRFAAVVTVHKNGIRSDHVKSVNIDEIAKNGGHGVLLAEHMIQELAFKLGRAPKYGA